MQSTKENILAYLKRSGGCSIDGCSATGTFTSKARRVCVGATCLDDVPLKYPVWDALGCSFLFQATVDIDLRAGQIVFCR